MRGFGLMTLSGYFAFIICAALLVSGIAAAVFSRRQRKAYEKLAKTETFHCLRCDAVYTAPAGSESQDCPQCGYKNPKLKF